MLGVVIVLCSALAAQEERSLRLEPALDLRIVSGSEWDTNARRAVSSSEVLLGPQRSQQVVGDGLVRLVVDADTRLVVTPLDVLRLNYVLGAKRFFREKEEDLLVHDLRFDTGHRLAGFLITGLDTRLRASRMRSGARDYTLKSGGAMFGAQFSEQWSLTAHGRYERLDFYFEPRFSNQGPAVSADLVWTPAVRFDVTAFGEVVWRDYDGNALVIVEENGARVVTYCDAIDSRPGCIPKDRNDNEIAFGARVLHRGAFLAGGEISARFHRSTSELERIDRYRITAFATFPLPWELKLSLLGGLQFNRGISATFANYRGEDDESQNSIEAQLARKITSEVGVDLRYALYANEFATSSSRFFRQTIYLGLNYEIDEGE